MEQALPADTISPRECYERCRAMGGGLLIDVRKPAEYAEAHPVGAISLPLERLEPAAVTTGRIDGEPIYLICQLERRSTMACELLLAAGVGDVHVVAGGMAAWVAAGLPTEGRQSHGLFQHLRRAVGILERVAT